MGGYGWSDDTGDSDRDYGGRSDDFRSARDAYKKSGSGSRSSSSSGGSSRRSAPTPPPREADSITADIHTVKHPIGVELKTDSTHPVVVMMDDTGSMGGKPAVILKKLPVLGDEVARVAPDYAISFALVSDARCDTYGLRVCPFDAGPALDGHLAKLGPQCGGGDTPESYGIGAYYLLEHCNIDAAVKPFCFFILDAPPHDKVLASEVKKVTGDKAQSPLDTAELFRRLGEKFSLYVILYGSKGSSTGAIWERLVGAQSVIYTSERDVGDIVELIAGTIAGELGAYDEYEMRSSKRHSDKPERVSRVSAATKSARSKSLRSSPAALDGDGGKSRRSKSGKSTGSKSGKSKKLI